MSFAQKERSRPNLSTALEIQISPAGELLFGRDLGRTGRNLDMQRRGAQTPLPPKIPRRQIYKALLGARAVNDGRGEKDECRDQSGGGREAKESARDRRLGRR